MVNDLFYDVFSHVTDLIGNVPELSMNNFDPFCFSFFFFSFFLFLIWIEVAIIIDNRIK